MDKKLLRQAILKKRLNQSQASALKKSRLIQKNLKKQPEFKKAKNILIYISKPDEVDTHELIKKHLGKKNLIVPKVNTKSQTLELHQLKNWGDLQPGYFNILEPKKIKKILKTSIDLAIIPAVAFDPTGHRVGYGQGFFDKLLKKIPAFKIGLGFEFQIVAKIENHHYDVAVDKIITEKRTIKCGN